MSIDWALFWDMGGHARYVWPGYAAALLLLVVELGLLWRALKRTLDGDAA